jgi:hypothetical protein
VFVDDLADRCHKSNVTGRVLVLGVEDTHLAEYSRECSQEA